MGEIAIGKIIKYFS